MKEHNFEQSDWTLDALLPAHAGEEFERILEELEQHVVQFEDARERLSPEMSDEEFLDVMRLYETIYATGARLIAYAQLWFSEDTQNQEALGFMGRMEQLTAEINNRTLFFSLWWKGLDEEPAQRLLAASGDYAYYLESLRRFKPYTLAETEEQIINLKDVNGVSALVNLYEMITNRFSFGLEVDGEVKEMTRAELSQYVRDPSPEVRAAASTATRERCWGRSMATSCAIGPARMSLCAGSARPSLSVTWATISPTPWSRRC